MIQKLLKPLLILVLILTYSCSSDSIDELRSNADMADYLAQMENENPTPGGDTTGGGTPPPNDTTGGDTPGGDTPDGPNTTNKTTYTKDVKPIIDAHCIKCHGNPLQNNAPIPFVVYRHVEKYAVIITIAMSKSTGANKAMPPTGRLPQSKIDVISQWIKDGKLE